jgi:hypothetical protein
VIRRVCIGCTIFVLPGILLRGLRCVVIDAKEGMKEGTREGANGGAREGA